MPTWVMMALCAGLLCSAASADRAVRSAASAWPLGDVRLLDGPFHQAQETNRAYLLRIDPDRLLSHVRTLAGLAPRAKPYGGWDAAGSQCIGHYLTAVSQMAATTGDPELRRRVSTIVSELAECQRAAGDGHIFTYPSDAEYFGKLASAEVPYVHVSPWYIVHKLMAGLRDAHHLCGEQAARNVWMHLADWSVKVTARLTPEQWQTMLSREHGGPHETLADLYGLTKDRKYLDLARKFTHDAVYAPLVRGDASVLTGLHANTQFPKFIGYERIYQLTGERARHDAAVAFWRDVVEKRSWANGGNSQNEHFFAPEEFEQRLLDIPGPETCNTYNLLRLTKLLFMDRPSSDLMDYYERGLLNHVLASQDPSTGGFIYHTPMRPNHYRMASSPFDCFWCCVNTGMESHSKHGEMIYARSADGVYVNLFIASEAHRREWGLTIRQETGFPDEPRTRLTIGLARPRRLALRIRKPSWVGLGFSIRINGKAVPLREPFDGYVPLVRTWNDGDTVQIDLPMSPRVEMLPHSSHWAAFLYGPILLAGGLGREGLTDADFVSQDGDQIPWKAGSVADCPGVSDPVTAARSLSPVPGTPLRFLIKGIGGSGGIELVPLFRLHRQRYAVYWPVRSGAEEARLRAERAAERKEAQSVDARTVDRVVVGDERSEKEHLLDGDKTETGRASWPYVRWRHAQGWFSYDLTATGDGPWFVRCVFWGGDARRLFEVSANGVSLATVRLDAPRPGEYVVYTFPLPPGTPVGGRVRVRFEGRDGSLAGGLFDLRLVRIEG